MTGSVAGTALHSLQRRFIQITLSRGSLIATWGWGLAVESGHCYYLRLIFIKEGNESQGNSGVSPGYSASKWYLDVPHLHFSLEKYLSAAGLASHTLLPCWG